MNWDGGGGYIASAVIGSIVMWVLMRIDRHSDHSKEATEGAHSKVDSLEKDFLRYQAHVAEHYQLKTEHREFEKSVFKKLDDIFELLSTKADKP
jgi:hypothetical protein